MARNRQFDMFEILDKRPELLGIGLDESTAIFVHGDEFEVIGKHYVAIYDGRFRSTERRIYSENSMDEKKFYFLKKGQKYNMRDRKVVEGQ
jgi:cyanophycinase